MNRMEQFCMLSGPLKNTWSLCCGVHSKRDHSMVNNNTMYDAAFRRNSLTTCFNFYTRSFLLTNCFCSIPFNLMLDIRFICAIKYLLLTFVLNGKLMPT